MRTAEELKRLGIDPDDCIVVGSGIMGALGIRQTDDLDLCVNQKTYDRSKALGWQEKTWPQGAPTIHSSTVDMGTDWGDGKNIYTFEELKKHMVRIDGVNYVDLGFLRSWKLNYGREKDLKDVEMIDIYLKEYPSS
jgi:hypothetical protein